jgi:hypothetical protein
MTSCDADIDWGSHKEEIVDNEDDDEGLQESDDNDLSLEIHNEEDNSNDDDNMVYDFHHPAQVSLCASLIVNCLLNLLISFLVTKVTLICPSTGEMD